MLIIVTSGGSDHRDSVGSWYHQKKKKKSGVNTQGSFMKQNLVKAKNATEYFWSKLGAGNLTR
jgi:hypothetical protein